MRSAILFFPLARRFKFADLNGVQKFMLKLGAFILRSDDIKNQIRNPVNGVARENLHELLRSIKAASYPSSS